MLAALLRPDATYVDVGTNRGQLLGEAVRVAPAGRHIAFEPIPELAEEVRRRVPARRHAASWRSARSRASAEFCHFKTMDGWSGLRRSPEVSDERGHPEYIQVQLSTLDAELAGVDPRVVKIDVEGAELDVVRGGRAGARAQPAVRDLRARRGRRRAVRVGLRRPVGRFDELGYEIFSITGDGPFARDAFAAAERRDQLAGPPGELAGRACVSPGGAPGS